MNPTPHPVVPRRRSSRSTRLALVAAAVVSLGLVACQPASPQKPNVRTPPRGAHVTWQYQLQGTIDRSVAAHVFDIDGFDTPAATVAALKRSGAYTVCYLSTSYENWRSDAGRYPASVLGRNLEGWAGERWVDIRKLQALVPIYAARADLCKAKGFDAIEWDNVDAYTHDTGFPLTANDQLTHNRFLAAIAHGRGLAVGLKNDTDQAAALAPTFDFAVVEECVAWNECGRYSAFTKLGKPVYVVEYDRTLAQTCAVTDKLGFSAIVKTYDLTAKPRQAC